MMLKQVICTSKRESDGEFEKLIKRELESLFFVAIECMRERERLFASYFCPKYLVNMIIRLWCKDTNFQKI